MAKSMTSENLHEVFSFPFQDPKRLEKFVIGSLLLLVSFLILPAFPLYGYLAELIRNAIEGKELSLPEWDAWEKKFSDGARLFLIGLIYSLPLAFFFIVVFIIFFAGTIGTEFIDSRSDLTAPIWMITSMFGTFGGLILFGLGFLLILIAGVIMPAMIGHVIAEDEFSAAFRFTEWWKIFRANYAGFAITYFIVLGLFTALNIINQMLSMTLILCCLLPFVMTPATFCIMMIISVLFGQAYREGVQRLQS